MIIPLIFYLVFVSQFLDIKQVFPSFLRVLKTGGYFGINKMFRADEVPPEARSRIEEGQTVFRKIIELPFTLNSPSVWKEAFESSGFSNLVVEEYYNIQQSSAFGMIDDFGGWSKIFTTLWGVLVLALRSKRLRQRFVMISRGKSVLLRDKVVSKYIGYILCVGEKL